MKKGTSRPAEGVFAEYLTGIDGGWPVHAHWRVRHRYRYSLFVQMGDDDSADKQSRS